MDTQPAMDKKAMAKAPPLPAKNGSEGTLKGEQGHSKGFTSPILVVQVHVAKGFSFCVFVLLCVS